MFIYQLLIRLLLPLAVLYLAITAFKLKKGSFAFFFQRLGFGYRNSNDPSNFKKVIWVHCASVGEVKAIEALVKCVSQSQPVLITTNTPTGKALVDDLFNHQIHHQYCPYDLPFMVRNIIKKFQPKALWVVETEIWPNLYIQCQKKPIPVSLINARLSKKTLKAPAWLKESYRITLNHTHQILCRNVQEAERFMTLGVEQSKVKTLGNLKYAGLTHITPMPSPIQEDYVLLASSHAGEELAIAQHWLKLNRPEKLVIVPRHPQRRNNILKDLQAIRPLLAVDSLNDPVTEDIRIILIDKIGVLMPLFSGAKVVIIGGSFTPKGGHNVLEPAAMQACIMTGPDMSDFENETDLLKKQGALIQVNDYDSLFTQLTPLLDQAETRQAMGDRAQKVIQSQQHILDDYLKQLDFDPDSSVQ